LTPDIVVRVFAEDIARDLPLPQMMTAGAAAADLRAALEAPVQLEPREIKMISTGLRIEIPHGYEGQVRPRSGLAAKHGITLLNTPGTIDSDYRGTVQVIMINLGIEPFTIQHGDRIAQLVIAPVSHVRYERAGELSPSERDIGGFGHTGIR
jgi:dUTP pyrophosphatase